MTKRGRGQSPAPTRTKQTIYCFTNVFNCLHPVASVISTIYIPPAKLLAETVNLFPIEVTSALQNTSIPAIDNILTLYVPKIAPLIVIFRLSCTGLGKIVVSGEY